MSNILLIYPPIKAQVPAKSTLLGLGYLASMLRQKEHKVVIKDYIGGLKDKQLDFNPEFIGISCMFNEHRKEIIKFIESIRQQFNKAHIIVGGADTAMNEEFYLYHPEINTVVIGEGEEVICDVVENKRKGVVIAERIRNLDKLPMPAWDLMIPDMQEMNKLSKKSPFLMRRPLAHIISSRGCPNECSFCAVKVAWGRQWVARSAENVIREIDYLYDLGFREIHFNDDNATVDKNRFHRICDGLIRNKIKVKLALPTGVSVKTLDYELLKHMKQAGFYRLCFGIETGNQEMQEKIHKYINLEYAKRVIKWSNELGYWTSATFISGFTDNPEQEKRDNLEFAKSSELDFPVFYPLQIQPKTELWNLTNNTKNS